MDKKVKLSAKRANEFAAKVIEADVTRRESEKKARKEEGGSAPEPTEPAVEKKVEVGQQEPGSGPNKKPRISSTNKASSSTTPATAEVSAESRKPRYAVIPVDTELEQLNRELAKRSNAERASSGVESKDEEDAQKRRKIIGNIEGVDIRDMDLGKGVNDDPEERV